MTKKEIPHGKHLLANYVSITGYARKKNILRKYVYPKMHSGEIIPDKIGEDGNLMIDWDKYKDVQFDNTLKEKDHAGSN